MARITVEDCLEHVENRFELVMIAAKRARQLARGLKEPLVPWENDKPTVVALREIEEGLIDRSILDERDEPEEEFDLALLAQAVERAASGETVPPPADEEF
ncbi:MAG: hypothetical protein KatS3mg124_2267 [Porticoccaceae bacterium]|nr:MAG: hypothetical protein KatS3mg124_2267 [Porticoccaceae bacterium]